MTSKRINDTKDVGNMNVKSWKKQNTTAEGRPVLALRLGVRNSLITKGHEGIWEGE